MSFSGNPNNMVEVRIPIMQRSTSVLDQDYGGSGGQFAEEMRKMEEEMGKLTGQINEGNKKIASRIVQKTTTTTTRTTSGGGPVPVAQPQQQAIQYNQQNQQFNQQQQFTQQQQQHPGQFNQPAPSAGGIVFSSPSPAGVQSHSTTTSSYSHQTTGNQGQPIQPSPVSTGFNQQQQQQQHHTSTFTHQNSGSNLQPQFHSPSPVPSHTSGGVQEHSSHHTSTSHKTVTHHGSSTTDQQQQQQQPQYGAPQVYNQQQNFDAANNQELQQWMSTISSPLIHDHQDISGQDGKCLRLRFDVSQYNADEISVKTVDGKLRIHAKHEEKSENRSSYREFNKEFSLPIGTDPAAIKSTLSKDGILTVEAPLPMGQLGYGGQQAIGF